MVSIEADVLWTMQKHLSSTCMTVFRVCTDLGKSWNLKVTFSRPGKSWNQAQVLEIRGKSWKCEQLVSQILGESALKDHRQRIPRYVNRRYSEKSIQKKLFGHLQSLQIKTIFQEKNDYKLNFQKITVAVYLWS